MNFLIANTFTDSLTKLTGSEQKAVKTTAFDLQMNPSNPGLKFHRIDNTKDSHFWSIRVNMDLRLIVHKTKLSLLLCYVNHHDDAYKWAEQRKIEAHPTTGAAQIIEIRNRVREIIIPKYIEKTEAKNKPLSAYAAEDILKHGVPLEWVDDIINADEDELLNLVDHIPGEAAEAVLDLATGVTPKISEVEIEVDDPFVHPDAIRRFRVMNNAEELERALSYPWDKWTLFLHPEQAKLVSHQFNGPARVYGSAGTGKTVVALHRAVYLARSDRAARILLTTFSKALATSLRSKLMRLISNEPRIADRIEVHSINHVASRLYEIRCGAFNVVSNDVVHKLIENIALDNVENTFGNQFLFSEWEQVVDGWQLHNWDDYRGVLRLGRKTRLPEAKRKIIWAILSEVRMELNKKGIVTLPEMFEKLSNQLKLSGNNPFDYIVIDEAQDVSVAQLKFISSLISGDQNKMFFAGDLGQRIFQQPFSWKKLGVDIRGRSSSLRINYRTSHQIRMKADQLLGPELVDVDGNIENRFGTISVFNGPKPEINIQNTMEGEINTVVKWIMNRLGEKILASEIGVFVRSVNELDRAIAVMDRIDEPFQIIDDSSDPNPGNIQITTMHLAKGLEFKAVVVMACDDEIIPSLERVIAVTDDSDLDDVYNTERHLLYVACTRARDNLLITCGGVASEFLDDLMVDM